MEMERKRDTLLIRCKKLNINVTQRSRLFGYQFISDKLYPQSDVRSKSNHLCSHSLNN
jgi:hypothetical protein